MRCARPRAPGRRFARWPATRDTAAPDRRRPPPSLWKELSCVLPCCQDLRRADGETDFPRQRLVRDLVGHLDLESVIALRERGERYCLPALQLMTGGQVELRRQRLRVQILRIRFVEELLRLAGELLVEVVLDAHVGLVRVVDFRVVN